MQDFVNRMIKVTYDNLSGWVSEVGYCLRVEGNFLLFKNRYTKKIKYLNTMYIRYVEIEGEMDEQGE